MRTRSWGLEKEGTIGSLLIPILRTIKYLFCLCLKNIFLFSDLGWHGKQALRCYMSIITALIFHCRTLVFPWLVLCPLCACVCVLCLHWQIVNCGWDDDEGTESEPEWRLRLQTLWEQTAMGWYSRRSGFSPVQAAVWSPSQSTPVGQTHNSDTTRPDRHSSKRDGGNGRSGSFSALLKGFLDVLSSNSGDSLRFRWGEHSSVHRLKQLLSRCCSSEISREINIYTHKIEHNFLITTHWKIL